jgi:cytochrome c peroxidase
MLLASCSPEDATEPRAPASLSETSIVSLVDEVRALTAAQGIGPLTRPASVRPELVVLGHALALDKILSGDKDISCMTCHLPAFATGDARNLSIGQGATGLGPARVHPEGRFIPRNAPPAFNLFAHNLLFWDGRVAIDAQGRLQTAAGERIPAAMRRPSSAVVLSVRSPSHCCRCQCASRLNSS